jgi:diketogulonate reductase-like aldo/keto reductase
MAKVAILLATVVAVDIPNVTLNNGLGLPMISFGTWQWDSDTAERLVRIALEQGFNHIDTAHNYNNQDGVGRALRDFDRSTYFITTKVMGQNDSATAYANTRKLLEDDRRLLGLTSLDLVLLHFPDGPCEALQEQWRAMEDFYYAGHSRAIGVSNYCRSSFECLWPTARVVPAVNQVEVHVGMGPDPEGIVSYGHSKGVVTQAYSPLGDGSLEFITGDLVSGIGRSHGKTGAQVSMRWLLDSGIPFSTKTTAVTHMQEDLDIFSFELAADEKALLDEKVPGSGTPSFMCSDAVMLVWV